MKSMKTKACIESRCAHVIIQHLRKQLGTRHNSGNVCIRRLWCLAHEDMSTVNPRVTANPGANPNEIISTKSNLD